MRKVTQPGSMAWRGGAWGIHRHGGHRYMTPMDDGAGGQQQIAREGWLRSPPPAVVATQSTNDSR
jgi:hypothetical protein